MKRYQERLEKFAKGRKIQNPKLIMTIYWFLRLSVVLTMINQVFQRDYLNVFLCLLTLILFMLPTIIERRLHVDLPDVLEVVILLFIFAADILGEIRSFYVLVPHWDTALYTLNGFLFAAIGFCIVDIFNQEKNVSFNLSPLYMAIAAFCFSMTIGVLWEFFEWSMDIWFGFDMQKDTVLSSISSVAINPQGLNEPVVLKDIQNVIVVHQDGTQQALNVSGYLDVGLQDTMKDLLVNLVGATVFSVIGYFYIKTRGQGRIAKHFIPTVMEKEDPKS